MLVRKSRLIAVGLLLVGALLISVSLFGATGTVYIDRNGDKQYDSSDIPLPGVSVSDGFTVVTTDETGTFTLKTSPKAKFVFISIPSGTQPLDCLLYTSPSPRD